MFLAEMAWEESRCFHTHPVRNTRRLGVSNAMRGDCCRGSGWTTRVWAQMQDGAEIQGICSKNAPSSMGREENTAKKTNKQK